MSKHLRPYQEFQDCETGEYTAEYQAFEQAVIDAGCENFDCNQVALAIKAGLTPKQAAIQFDQDFENNIIPSDWDDIMNHDFSMNY